MLLFYSILPCSTRRLLPSRQCGAFHFFPFFAKGEGGVGGKSSSANSHPSWRSGGPSLTPTAAIKFHKNKHRGFPGEGSGPTVHVFSWRERLGSRGFLLIHCGKPVIGGYASTRTDQSPPPQLQVVLPALF